MRMPIFHDVFVKLMIIYFFFQDQCIAKLESLGFRIGQSLVERYFSIYIFKNHQLTSKIREFYLPALINFRVHSDKSHLLTVL